LIEELYKGKSYYSKMAAVFVAVSNDCGLRFSEIATLKRKDVQLIENFYLLTVSESKTAKRTVICALAKKFLDEWFKLTKKNEFVFEPLEGDKDSQIVYNSLRKNLILACKKLNIDLIQGHSFHTFRHCASSRLRDMSTNEKRYFMGWKQDGLESIYTRVSWEDCKEHYFKSLKENPMLDFSLSEYEERGKSQEEALLEMVREAVKKELAKKS
jgi:integrase